MTEPTYTALSAVELTPPAPAPVPVGFATKGGVVAALSQFVAAIALIVAGETLEGSIALASSTLTLLTVLGGRFAQAVVIARAFAKALAEQSSTATPVSVGVDVDVSPEKS